ncbi:hypothetical protein FQU76_17255 [Streptomyces qinzhouensis]|uniref:Uncharacterized protein n=1 Tax=Streptomyces qinzhouensis TaxID=2599401 RepID=A0A5B8JKC2_9ACTN|nr:hypothetical protein FQU76_17255 [Streptomyces qinzhouensis]
MPDSRNAASGPMPEYCVYCDRPVGRSEENLVMLGFSASGSRPSLYAHPECPRPRKARARR